MVGPVAERTDAHPDRPGVVVKDVELVAVLVDRDDVAGLVPRVADGVAGRFLLERRDQPGPGVRPGGGEQGDLVAAVGQPVGEQRHHPLDAAVAAGRDRVPGRSDQGDAHTQVVPRQFAQQTEEARRADRPPGPARPRGGRYAERVPGLWSPSDVGRSDRLSTSARISLSGYRRWPPRVRTKGSLPSLAQRETVFGRHLEQRRGLRRGQVLGLTRLGLAHWTPSYGHGPDRTSCRSWCVEPAAAKLLRIR